MAFSVPSWLSRTLSLNEAPTATVQHQARQSAEPYHSVSIKPGEECCEAARQFGQKRFLAARAPRLPLPECAVTACECRYSHYSDRRSGDDRRAVFNWEQERDLGVVNRRWNHGRRATDAIA